MANAKEAVVFILDANQSMAGNYGYDTTTKFECAKQTILDMVADLMIRSKTNEVCVVVLKTMETHHHFHDDDTSAVMDQEQLLSLPFPNITEYGGDGMLASGVMRPSPELLRKVNQLQATTASSTINSNTNTTSISTDSSDLRGDFCDGIIVAADALYRRTSGKKYQRRIVLFTDAQHQVAVDSKQLLVVLDSLRAMECQLQVIGLDFTQQAEFDKAAEAPVKKEPKDDDDNDNEETDNGSDASSMEEDEEDDDDEEEDDDEEQHTVMVQQQNERLLIGLTEKTGGFVMAAKEVQQILKKTLGKRVAKSIRRKFIFRIAPGLVLEEARFSLLISKASAPTLQKQVVQMDDVVVDDQHEAKPKKNAIGDEMTSDIQTIVSHWDPEKEEEEVTDVAYAYRYGSDLVPMGGFDLQGLTKPSPVCIQILGYLQAEKVPRELMIGPPYAISGADSRRACATVSALARALQRTKQVGIATMVKSKDADPILVGLFPLQPAGADAVADAEGATLTNAPIHLVVLQLPFQGDVPKLSLSPLDVVTIETTSPKAKACDDLIDALMLPPETGMDYTSIPNPYIRAFHKTVVQRALDPSCPVVAVRTKDNDDPMRTPPEIVKRAQPAIDNFHKTFPLSTTNNKQDNNGNIPNKRKGPATYRDFVDD
jgi:ATP-dependent DNA helicase 2 subunit 2